MVKKVIIIASYKEYEALPILLNSLSTTIDRDTKILIVDDSPQISWQVLKTSCLNAMEDKNSQIDF